RVDLGVVDPDRPTTFLAGIECDGATYHRSATTRDRDRLRQAVLENLGWTILRIWSTDWWTNAQRECDRLDKALQDLLDRAREERALQEEEQRAQMPQLSAEAEDGASEEPNRELSPPETDSQEVSQHTSGSDRKVSPDAPQPYARAPEYLMSQSNGRLSFTEQPSCEGQMDIVPDQTLFFKETYTPVLLQFIRQAVNRLGPVREDVLVQTLSRQHGFARAGRDIRDRLQGLIPSSFARTQEEVGTFIWPETLSPEEPLAFKAPATSETLDPATVPLTMLVSLAKTLLPTGLPDEELIATMRKACGMARMGAAIRSRFEAALALSRDDKARVSDAH
ncbi:MAG: DUF3320 domain-containing protein, partial [Acetobacter persici]